jgi:molybdopterin synthase sulfur carrier subunit
MEQVTVKVLFFAVSKEISGRSESELRVKSRISYDELKQLICDNFGLEVIKQNIILAVNQDYCDEGDLVLKNNDELAVIPPLSAG